MEASRPGRLGRAGCPRRTAGAAAPKPPRPAASRRYSVLMADAAQKEPVAPRIAAVREQLSLLSDYL